MISSIQVNKNLQKIWISIYLATPQNFRENIEHAADVTGGVRYIAVDKPKELYVFSDAISHDQVIRKLGLENRPIINGFAKSRSGKWITTEITNSKEADERDWSWVDGYIELTPHLEKLAYG